MNRRGNQRYQDTERAILEAASALIEAGEPSVRAICERAGINRSTFYLHFADVYALMDKLEAVMSAELVAAITRRGTPDLGEGFVNMFAFIREHAPFYRAYMCDPARPRPLPFVLPAECLRGLAALRAEQGLVSEREFEYVQGFFMAGVSDLIRRWLDGGCREEPREITRIMLNVFQQQAGSWWQWS
ncbi:MAG: TetR/AcrR family transcriptional regulator [Candidatus Fimadaptatus sp.]